MAQQAATPVFLLLFGRQLPATPAQHTGPRIRGVRTPHTVKPGPPSQPTPPTRPDGVPLPPTPPFPTPGHTPCGRPAGKVRAAGLRGPAPAPPGQDLASPRAAPLRSAATARACHEQPALGSPSPPGNAEPKGQGCPTPRTPGWRKAVSEPRSRAEAARGQPPAEGRGRRGARGRGRAQDVQTFGSPSGLPPTRRSADGARPFSLRRGRRVLLLPGGRSGPGPRRGGSTPSRILTTRGARAAQPERQQHPQPSRAQGGHLLDRLLLRRRRRHRRGRSTWGGGPDRGAPHFLLPLAASADHSAALHRETRAPLPCAPSQPSPSPGAAAASAAARSLAATFWAVQRSSLVCPSASAASAHLKPRPLPPAPRGFPQEEAPAGRAARGGIYERLPDTPAAPGPRRGPARPSERHGRGAPAEPGLWRRRLTLHGRHRGFRDLELAGTARPHPGS